MLIRYLITYMIVVEVVQASKELGLGGTFPFLGGRWVVATTLLPVDHLIAHQMQRHRSGQYSTQETNQVISVMKEVLLNVIISCLEDKDAGGSSPFSSLRSTHNKFELNMRYIPAKT